MPTNTKPGGEATGTIKALIKSLLGKLKKVEPVIEMEDQVEIVQNVDTGNCIEILPPGGPLTAARIGCLACIRELSGQPICDCMAAFSLEIIGNDVSESPNLHTRVSLHDSLATAFKLAEDFPNADFAMAITTYALTDIEASFEEGSQLKWEEGWYKVVSFEYPRIYQHPRHRYLFVAMNESHKGVLPNESEVNYLLATAVALLIGPDQWSNGGLPRVTLFTTYGTTARTTHLFFHQNQAHIAYSPYYQVDPTTDCDQLFKAASKQEQYSLFMANDLASTCRCGGATVQMD